MERLLAAILCLCFMNSFSYALQTPNSAGIETRKEKFQELNEMTEKFHKQLEALRAQIKTEKDEVKIKNWKAKIRDLYQEFNKNINAKRAEMGLPVQIITGEQDRKEAFQELKALIEKFHKEQVLLREQIKAEKDEVKLKDLQKKMKELYLEFKKNLDIKQAELGIETPTPK